MRAFLLLVLTALLAPAAALAVDADGDGYDHTVDCDDGDASVHPGAYECGVTYALLLPFSWHGGRWQWHPRRDSNTQPSV